MRRSRLHHIPHNNSAWVRQWNSTSQSGACLGKFSFMYISLTWKFRWRDISYPRHNCSLIKDVHSPHPCCTCPFHSHRLGNRTPPIPCRCYRPREWRWSWIFQAGPPQSPWLCTVLKHSNFHERQEATGGVYWPACLTWSPNACLPMVMGCVQPGTSRGMFLQMIGSRKTVPPRMFLMVPLGLFHIFFRLNS